MAVVVVFLAVVIGVMGVVVKSGLRRRDHIRSRTVVVVVVVVVVAAAAAAVAVAVAVAVVAIGVLVAIAVVAGLLTFVLLVLWQ